VGDPGDAEGAVTGTLTSKQRAHLRSLAHRLKPMLQVGQEGLEPRVLASILEAFNTRELLKVKVLENAPADVRDTAGAIVDALPDVHVAQTIGRTIVLYREDPDAPEIRLPRRG
jgi:RNA-binding protein